MCELWWDQCVKAMAYRVPKLPCFATLSFTFPRREVDELTGSLRFVHRSRTILCHPVPNPKVASRFATFASLYARGAHRSCRDSRVNS
jgi:hypothetical protein